MNLSEIAARLVEFCRRQDYAGAHKELYAADAVSIEPDSTAETTVRGLPGLAEKSKMFEEMFEVHSAQVSEPIVADSFFSCSFTADVTHRKAGARFTMSEIGVFEVRNGKIVSERFFYEPRD